MSPLLKNTLFALALALILWFGYRMFFAADDSALLDTEVVSDASRDTQAFLRTLQQLRTITFDEKIFDDTRFQSLVDYRQAIIAEPVGRRNPFVPVAGQ